VSETVGGLAATVSRMSGPDSAAISDAVPASIRELVQSPACAMRFAGLVLWGGLSVLLVPRVRNCDANAIATPA